MLDTLDEKLTFFFALPEHPQGGPFRSTLYLLRREIQDCLIGKVVPEKEVLAEAAREHHRVFATAMVIGAGIDLLAKFYTGSDARREVGRRFMAFAGRYIFTWQTDGADLAKVLYYGLRNPLMHSFSIRSEEYRVIFVSGARDTAAVWKPDPFPDHFAVSIEGLYGDFSRALKHYEEDLGDSQELRANFELMFRRYGWMPFASDDASSMKLRL